MENIVSHGNICYDISRAMKTELPMEESISKGHVCYDQDPKPFLCSVGANTKPTTKSRVSPRDLKIMVIVTAVIMLLLSATCAGTVYTAV